MKKYAANLIENGGNKRQAALAAGYSQAIADNPKKIEERKGFQELVDLYLPDDFLLRIHHRNIKQTQDKGASDRALDLAYKLKRKYPQEDQNAPNTSVRVIIASPPLKDNEDNPPALQITKT